MVAGFCHRLAQFTAGVFHLAQRLRHARHRTHQSVQGRVHLRLIHGGKESRHV